MQCRNEETHMLLLSRRQLLLWWWWRNCWKKEEARSSKTKGINIPGTHHSLARRMVNTRWLNQNKQTVTGLFRMNRPAEQTHPTTNSENKGENTCEVSERHACVTQTKLQTMEAATELPIRDE
jgi:hypothetical protein